MAMFLIPRRRVRGVLQGAQSDHDRARRGGLVRVRHRRAPAAAVVFAGDVNARTAKDPRVAELEARFAAATDGERAVLATQLMDARATVRARS